MHGEDNRRDVCVPISLPAAYQAAERISGSLSKGKAVGRIFKTVAGKCLPKNHLYFRTSEPGIKPAELNGIPDESNAIILQ